MNEREYICLVNLTALRVMKKLLREIIKGDEYHVPNGEFTAVYIAIDEWTSNLELEEYIDEEA